MKPKHTPGLELHFDGLDIVQSNHPTEVPIIAALSPGWRHLGPKLAAAPELLRELNHLINFLHSMNLQDSQECLNAMFICAKVTDGVP